MATAARPTADKPTMLRSCWRNSNNVPERFVSKLRVASRRSGVPEKDVGDMQRSSVAKLFVNRLHDETTVADVKALLSVICKDQLVRVQRLDTRRNDYASYKVTVPAKLKVFLAFIDHMENMGLDKLRHFNHRSRPCIREMLLVIGKTVGNLKFRNVLFWNSR